MQAKIAELSLEQLSSVVGGEICQQRGMDPKWSAQGARTGGALLTGFGTRQACRDYLSLHGQ